MNFHDNKSRKLKCDVKSLSRSIYNIYIKENKGLGYFIMRNLFGTIISKEISNRQRQSEIDIAKGLAVFFMILVHFCSTFLDTAYNGTIFDDVISFMGCVPAAPVFMFVMGVGFVYSKKQEPEKLFRRGLYIFFGGYILNFFRGVLPLLIGNKLGYYELPQTTLPGYGYLFEVDILQFAGMAMIIVAFLKGVKISEVFYPFAAVFAAVISPYMWQIKTQQPILDIILSPVLGGTEYTYHPVFSWIFYPLMGAFFGWLLIRVKDKNAFYATASIVSVFILFIGLFYSYKHPEYDFGIVTGEVYNYFQHGILSNLIFVAAIICWLALWNLLMPLIPQFIKKKLTFWSKATTPMYVIHWLYLSWCSFLVFDTFDIKQSILGIIILIISTEITADLYIKIKDRLSEREEIDIPAIIEN